jgi:hypothetical protein
MTDHPRTPAPVVPYADHKLPGAPPLWTPWLVVVLVWVGVAAVTCVRIEILNAQANFYLPRQDMEGTGNHKWVSGYLTHDARDDLHEVVESWGLLQYPLVALLTVTLVTMLPGKGPRRRIVALALVIVLICGALMFYRGYFTSLAI